MFFNSPTGKKLAEIELPRWLMESTDESTLSSGEAALLKITEVLSEEFDALDGPEQEKIALALHKIAQESLSAESCARIFLAQEGD